MKHKFLSFLLTLLMSMVANVAMAYDAYIDGIYYNLSGDEATVTYKDGYDSYSGSVVIPETVTYNGKTYSITSIGNDAFWECIGLTSVTIPNSVTSIGNTAFYHCRILTSITIPDGVTSIGDCAFMNCSYLNVFTVPNSVTSIGREVFVGCSSLVSIIVEEENKVYDSRNNCNAIIETASNTLIAGCKNTTIIEGVTSIGDRAFSSVVLTTITIPNSVTTIGNNAFYGSRLESVTIPNSVTSIGKGAFSSCSNLSSIIVQEGNPVYDSRNGCNAIIEKATNTLITGCQTTVIPSGVTSIGDYAFVGCRGLTSINIPNSVTSIGNDAFYGCSGLTSITIPEGVTSIGEWAFGYCSKITSFNIPNSVTKIGVGTFRDCSGLTSVTIPNSVTSIGENAFFYCRNLTSINIPNSVTSIGRGAFKGCSGLSSITIPSSVTDIEYEAFTGTAWYDNQPDGLVYAGKVAYNYKGIMPENTTIDIQNGTLCIGRYAFRGCKGLISITIPNSVTSIGEWAFSGCSGLTSVTIPSSVTEIGINAFEECNGLTSINISESVTSIGETAFYHCGNLTSIKVGMKTPISIALNVFWSSYEGATLYVPFGSKATYEATYPWNHFGNIVECNYVDAEDMSIAASNSSTMEINVNNFETNIVGFQMDLTLPEGVGIDKAGCSLSSRITDENQELTIGKLEDGTYRLTSTSLSLTPISGNNGTLLTLKLKAENGCVGGQATISNIRFSTSESKKIIMSDESFDISILYNLTYMVDGEEYKTTKVAYGTTLTPEFNPTKEGHTFHLNGELPATMPNRDVVVTGSFSVNSYTLTYIVDGEEYKTSTIAYGTAITSEEEPVKEGYTFSGWSEIPETMPAHDVTVTGTFTINSYTLTYILDGEVYKTESVVYGTPLEPEQTLFKNGYTFSGWSEIPETMPAHDVTITGSFTINSYTLTYMLNDEIYRTETVVYGTPLTPEPALVKEGYTFSGWSAIPETMPAHDVIVTGTLTINSYTLTYIVDGEVYKTSTVVYDTALTPEAEPTKEGHTFSGWSEIPETMPANDVTVTGTFTINSYTLTYLLDGEVYKTESVVYGTTITPESELTKEGYTFSGWSEQPETMPAHDVTVTGAFYLYGDVNTDEAVDVVDVVDIARYVVATPSAKFREKLADLNFDSSVNIADAVTLVNHIAGDQNFVKALSASRYDQCQLQLLSAGGNALSFCLDGEADFTAFQFEVDVPDGTDISAISINGTRKDGHQLLYNKLDDNRYRVTALSLSNAVFKGSKGELLQFSISGQDTDDICVHDIHFVTTNGKDITFDVLYVSGTETGIANMNVNEDKDTIYDLLGRKLSKVQRGVNIINGRKVIVNK